MRIPFLLLLPFLSFELLAQNENNFNYTVADGLPSNMVYCTQQDDRGFMWFGSDAGLSKFDGYEFTNYTLEDHLPDTEILKFFKDSQDRIWFYTLNGKIGFVQNDSIFSSKNTSWLKELDFKGRITGILEINEKLYFTAVDNFYKILDGKQVKKVDLKKNHTWSICFCNNQLYLLSPNNTYIINLVSGLLQINNGFNRVSNYTVYTYPICLQEKIYSYSLVYKDIQNLLEINSKSVTKFPVSDSTDILNIEVINNELYVLTKLGVSKFNTENKKFKHYSEVKSSSSIFQDSESNIWYTSIKSGIHFQPSVKVRFDSRIKNIDAISSIDDFLYLAHSKTTLSKKNSQGFYSDFLTFQQPNTTNFIAKDNFGQILTGRNSGTFLGDQKIISSKAKSIIFLDSSIYVGSRGKLKILNGAESIPPVFSGNVQSLYAINKDSILLGTDNGLFVVNGDSILFPPAYRPFLKSPLFHIRINNIIPQKNRLWMATSGNGILQYCFDGSVTQLSIKEGLMSSAVTDMVINDSIIWAVTPKGINKVVLGQSEILSIDGSDGLNSYQINDIEYFNDSIYLATNEGLYSFPTNIDLLEPNDFPFFIDKVLDDKALSQSNVISYDYTSLQITFKALIYRNNNSLVYEYQLVDYEDHIQDDNWIGTNFNTVNFSKLTHGRYQFYARAKTKNSNWSTPISYEFEIRPAFWQTLWFQLIAILSSVSLVVIYFVQKSKRKQAQEHLEKAKISAELTALKAQINPHFLFNVLNSIQSYILENEKEIAQEYLVKYGRLMRMVLEDSDQLIVPLESEIKMLSLYTDLEKLRLKNGFEFEVIVSDYFDSRRVMIPSMIIQPFIENAIWHGLSPLNQKGKITLKINHHQDHIEVLIMDNGVGFDQNSKKESNHISSGVRLVRERLNLIHDVSLFKSDLEINSELGKGTSITILFSDNLTG